MKLKFVARSVQSIADLPVGALFITQHDTTCLYIKLAPTETGKSDVAIIDHEGKCFIFAGIPREAVVIRVKLGDIELLEW